MPTISDFTEADVVERLGRDVISTVGPEYLTVVRSTARAHRAFTDDPDRYVERVVEDVQQYFHDTFVDTTWPACPRHPNHPMWFGGGWWLADGRPLVRLGELGSSQTDEVQEYYARFPEEGRLSSGPSQLEFERTKDVLTRVLPAPPCRVVDVGGAAGAYSTWLAELGYDVHLVDASPRLVEEARSRSSRAKSAISSISVGDARRLPRPDESAEAVLIMGPLYHLTDAADRLLAIREALRVLTVGGVLVAAAISRFASALDGFSRDLAKDPVFRAIRDRDLVDGQHRNSSANLEYFTTAYFHRPEDLVRELEVAGFRNVVALGVEGPTWILPEFDRRWNDVVLRRDLLDVARVLEREPSIIGASAHLLGIGTKG